MYMYTYTSIFDARGRQHCQVLGGRAATVSPEALGMWPSVDPCPATLQIEGRLGVVPCLERVDGVAGDPLAAPGSVCEPGVG